MPPIVEGQSFESLKEFKEALRQWAIEGSWTPSILDSDSHRVRAGCRSSKTCPFRIRANYSGKRGDARVTTVDDVHNCTPFDGSGPSHQNIKRAETGKLKFLLKAVPRLMNVTLETNVHQIIEVVERQYGQKIPIRQAQKVKGSLVKRIKGPCRQCHRIGHTRRQCPQLKSTTSEPIEFASDPIDFSRDDQDPNDYADNTMDDTFGSDQLTYDHHPDSSAHLYPQAPPRNGEYQPTQAEIDPGLNGSGDPSYNTPHMQARTTPLPPLGIQTARAPFPTRSDLTAQQNNSQHSNPGPHHPFVTELDPTSGTRDEMEAKIDELHAKAAQLMQEALQATTEANRLTATLRPLR